MGIPFSLGSTRSRPHDAGLTDNLTHQSLVALPLHAAPPPLSLLLCPLSDVPSLLLCKPLHHLIRNRCRRHPLCLLLLANATKACPLDAGQPVLCTLSLTYHLMVLNQTCMLRDSHRYCLSFICSLFCTFSNSLLSKTCCFLHNCPSRPVMAKSPICSKSEAHSCHKEHCPNPTWASRSICCTLSPSPSPSLRAMDKTPTKADFVIGQQTLVLVEQPLGSSVEGRSTMPPSTLVKGQMTNDAQAPSPKVLTDQNTGQVSAPVCPEWDTPSLPVSTEMTSSPSPNSAPAVTYAKAAKPLVNSYQLEPPSLVAPPADPSKTRMMCLLETVAPSIANLSSHLTNVEQNLISGGYPEEPD